MLTSQQRKSNKPNTVSCQSLTAKLSPMEHKVLVQEPYGKRSKMWFTKTVEWQRADRDQWPVQSTDNSGSVPSRVKWPMGSNTEDPYRNSSSHAIWQHKNSIKCNWPTEPHHRTAVCYVYFIGGILGSYLSPRTLPWKHTWFSSVPTKAGSVSLQYSNTTANQNYVTYMGLA
jgi:hypothetical protein